MADSSNTARNFIFTGVLLGVGAAAMGAYIMSSEKILTIDPHVEGNGKTGTLTQEAVKLKENALAPRMLADVAPKDAAIPRIALKDGSEPRYTPLFFAPKLWVVHNGNAKNVVDLMGAKAPNVHASVKNSDFFKYGLEDIIGNPNALEMDSDGDGFTNGEEFAAGTNPNNKDDMPPFAMDDSVKMVYTRTTEEKHSLVLSSSYPFTDVIDISIHDWVGGARNPNRTSQRKALEMGQTFGYSETEKEGALSATRFKIAGKGEENGKKYIEIEDTYTKLPSAKTFRLFPGANSASDVSDVNIHLRITAGPAKMTNVKVQLGETFEVPGFKDVICTIGKHKKNITATIQGKEEPIVVKKAPSAAKK